MKDTGHPEHPGEVRYQAGAVATSVETDDGLQWEVRRDHDGLVRYTPQLAHIWHWHRTLGPKSGRTAPKVRTFDRDFNESAPLAAAATGGTQFYPDCSNNNWTSVQEALDFVGGLKAQGFAGMCHKMSEGDYYEDPFGAPVQQYCAQIGFPFLGYHYVTTNSPAGQLQTWRAAGGGANTMFDWEANGGDLANYYAVASGFNNGGVNVGVGYAPRWYWNQVGGGDLSQAGAIVSSAYPGGSGYASTIYADCGGDSGAGWDAYGGVTPTCWQFTDAANISGYSMDCNAFKGTTEQLAQLFSGGTTPVTQPDGNGAEPLTNAQLQDMYNWSLLAFQFLFGPLTNNPANVGLLPGSPTPVSGSPFPLGDSSVAAAIAALQNNNGKAQA